MKHADVEQKSSAAGQPSDMPALLVPGGSRSSLCRSRSISRAGDDTAVQWLYCTDNFWNAAKEEWDKLSDSDRLEIEGNGISTLVERLRDLYKIGEDEALAKINALSLDMSRRTGEPEASGHRRSTPSPGGSATSSAEGPPNGGESGQPREQS